MINLIKNQKANKQPIDSPRKKKLKWRHTKLNASRHPGQSREEEIAMRKRSFLVSAAFRIPYWAANSMWHILTWTWDSTSCCGFNNCYRKRRGEGKEDIYILLTQWRPKRREKRTKTCKDWRVGCENASVVSGQ